jgi:hypothetical protein
MKPSHAASNNLIEQTHKVWQPRLQRNLTDEDARQIAENVTGFFAILAEWSRAARLVPADDHTVSAPTDTAEVCHDR